MNLINILGIIAGTLTTVAFIPQVLQTWRSKSAKDISLGMFSMFSLGVFLWLIYGIYTQSLPIIIANSVTFVLALIILFFKFKYD